jgi:hypothetical protein
MNPDKFKKASNLLAKIIIWSLVIIMFTTVLYYWKGLGRLQDPEGYEAYYYESI